MTETTINRGQEIEACEPLTSRSQHGLDHELAKTFPAPVWMIASTGNAHSSVCKFWRAVQLLRNIHGQSATKAEHAGLAASLLQSFQICRTLPRSRTA